MNYEFIVEYKCNCNSQIHTWTCGVQKNEIQPDLSKIRCKECDSIIKVQKVNKVEVEEFEGVDNVKSIN